MFLQIITLLLVICLPSVYTFSAPSVASGTSTVTHEKIQPSSVAPLAGDWKGAKHSLRSPDCCVVSVPGLDHHLRVLQEKFADSGPSDLDLRARVRVNASAYEDCLAIRRSVLYIDGDDDDDEINSDMRLNDPCTDALVELARGVASLADGPLALDGVCEDVFIRIVCASQYKAHDPMYHTDKAPLRGYVTLRGVGTEFMTRTCSPLEYVTLRGFGGGVPTESIRQAEELEFIVMKGDYYDCDETSQKSFVNKLWTRAEACVHRSPPGSKAGGRRVIISLDLADGDDDREWYQANTKRNWRSGMTQRKSRLVA